MLTHQLCKANKLLQQRKDLFIHVSFIGYECVTNVQSIVSQFKIGLTFKYLKHSNLCPSHANK